MTTLLPDEKRNIFIVFSKIIECFFSFEIFMIVLESKCSLIHNFVKIREIMLIFGNFVTSYNFSNCSIEVLVLLKCLFIFFLVTFSLFNHLWELLSSLFTGFHDFFFLNLVIFKCCLPSINLACIEWCQDWFISKATSKLSLWIFKTFFWQ